MSVIRSTARSGYTKTAGDIFCLPAVFLSVSLFESVLLFEERVKALFLIFIF